MFEQFDWKVKRESCPFTEEQIYSFVKESNAIERIFREPHQHEIDEFIKFTSGIMTVDKIINFVSAYEPSAKIRNQYGMNVRVGSYYPPFGSPNMEIMLNDILNQPTTAFTLHLKYERLHPFMDCNGRSGRALWAWKRQNISGGFLLNFYFETLQNF